MSQLLFQADHSPEYLAAACLNNFLQACPKRGAKSAVVETNVEQGITSLCQMDSAVTAVPTGAPGTGHPVLLQANAAGSISETYRKAVDNKWDKQNVVGMEELLNSGQYPFLCCAVDHQSSFAELIRVLEQRASGEIWLTMAHRNRKNRSLLAKIGQLATCRCAAYKSSDVIEKLRVQVSWYSNDNSAKIRSRPTGASRSLSPPRNMIS